MIYYRTPVTLRTKPNFVKLLVFSCSMCMSTQIFQPQISGLAASKHELTPDILGRKLTN